MGRQVTILGMGPTARAELEPIGEVWSLNNAYDCFNGITFDRYFELHSLAYLKTWKPNAHHDHFTRLDLLGCPVLMQAPVPAVRLSRRYPLDDICRTFGTNYFLGSPSFMLALAIYEGVNDIRVYGIDTSDPQHAQQRQSWTYWLRVGQELGVRFSGAHPWLGEVERDEGLAGYRETAIPALQSPPHPASPRYGSIFAVRPRSDPAQAPNDETKTTEPPHEPTTGAAAQEG